MLGVPEGEGGVAALAGELLVCGSVSTHVVHVLVTLLLLLPTHLEDGDQLEEQEH